MDATRPFISKCYEKKGQIQGKDTVKAALFSLLGKKNAPPIICHYTFSKMGYQSTHQFDKYKFGASPKSTYKAHGPKNPDWQVPAKDLIIFRSSPKISLTFAPFQGQDQPTLTNPSTLLIIYSLIRNPPIPE